MLPLAAALVVTAAPGRGPVYHVSSSGRDSWSGRTAVPHGTDGPFATLERARDAIRAARGAGQMAAATVVLHGGTYARRSALALDSRDSHERWVAAPGERPVLSGGVRIWRWSRVTDTAILTRLTPDARRNVLVSDLASVQDLGNMARRGFGAPIVPAGMELFWDGKAMTLARWPNEGWASITTVPGGPTGGVFGYPGDRPAQWKPDTDIWVHGYWTYDWADSWERVASIDTNAKTVHTVAPHGVYGYSAGRRFRFENVLEELDSPGEWYLDRAARRLYFWPPAGRAADMAVVSVLASPLITIRGAEDVTVAGLTIQEGRSSGIEIDGGHDVACVGCTLRNLGTYGARISGENNALRSCDIYGTGDGGVQVSGGDRQTLAPARNTVENCDISDYARWDFTYRPGVLLDGVGNRIVHNRIWNSPHTAILFTGNDHEIAYNDIFSVCLETGDAGAVYTGRSLTMRGTVIEDNLFHDVQRRLSSAGGYPEVMSVYLDDCDCGTTVRNNLFVRAGRAIMVGGGRDNTIVNNLFVNCDPAIHVDARGIGWAKFWFDGRDPTLMNGLKAVPYQKPPYSDRYPHLANILADDPAVPKYNLIERNIVAGGRPIDWLDGMSDKVVTVRNNWFAGDPGFVDAMAGDYLLRPGAPASAIGFHPLAVRLMGLYTDRWRRSLPAPEPGRPKG